MTLSRPRCFFVSCFVLVSVSVFTGCGAGRTAQPSSLATQSATADAQAQTATSSVPPPSTSPAPPTVPAQPPSTPSPSPTPNPSPTPAPTPKWPQHLYFGYSGLIYGFELHQDGSLTATPNSPYVVGGNTQQTSGLVQSPSGTVGLATTGQDCPRGACYGTPSISTFTVSQDTGELDLTKVNADLGSLADPLFDNTGSFLYTSTYQGTRVFSVSPQGELTELTGSPFSSEISGFLRHDTSSNRFFIVGYTHQSFLQPFISAFTPKPDGTPQATTEPTSFVSTSPRAVTIDSEGKYLFVLGGSATSGNLHVFSIASGITEVQGSPFYVVSNAYSIAIDPSDSSFYAASIIDGIAQYSFDKETGRIGERLSLTAASTISTLAFDASGKYLIATNLPKIYVYEPDSTGALHLVSVTTLF